MTLAAARKQAPDNAAKAQRADASPTSRSQLKRQSNITRSFIQRKPTCACGGGCPRCDEESLQAELMINQPGDRYEREADRVSEQVMHMPETQIHQGMRPIPISFTPSGLQRKCACGGTPGPDGECAECREKRLRLQRRAANQGESARVPPVIHAVLRSPGRPLDASTRTFMEARFGHDFSQVRVHTDAQAAESARAVNALAYTVGSDVAFGAGQYAPGTPVGRWLLAHELAHVVQQRDQTHAETYPVLEPPVSPSEREAKTSSDRVISGGTVAIQHAVPAGRVQRLVCDDLLRAREAARVSGTAAHTAIQADFVAQKGTAAFPIRSIPAASWSHSRLQCGDEPWSTVEEGVAGGGRGYPDLVLRNSAGDVELAEIKPAHFTCIPEAEGQVRHYRNQGNAQRRWRRQEGLGTFVLMSPGSYSPRSPLSVGTEPITVAWCEPGVMVYKAIRDLDPEVFLCSNLSDRGRVDQFLDNVLGRAQAEVDRYISQVVDGAISRAIDQLTVREAVLYLYRFGRDALREFVTKMHGPAGGLILESLPSEAAVEWIARRIEQQIGGPQTVQYLRQLAHSFKRDLLNRVRQRMQDYLRNYLQSSLTALCAGAATVTIALLLRRLAQDMARLFGSALADVLEEVARAAMLAVLKALAIAALMALAVVAVVVIIVFLPEILAGIAAIGAPVLAVLAALIPVLIRLLPVAQRLIPAR